MNTKPEILVTPPGQTAHVIFCNDRPEAVTLDGEEHANTLVESMAKAEYDSKYANGRSGRQYSWEEYRHIFYWHHHEVPLASPIKEIDWSLIKGNSNG